MAVPLLNSFRKLCISVLMVLALELLEEEPLVSSELVAVLLYVGGDGGNVADIWKVSPSELVLFIPCKLSVVDVLLVLELVLMGFL